MGRPIWQCSSTPAQAPPCTFRKVCAVFLCSNPQSAGRRGLGTPQLVRYSALHSSNLAARLLYSRHLTHVIDHLLHSPNSLSARAASVANQPIRTCAAVWVRHICWCLQVVPFFFYRGLECLTYSWSDRAFQALFTAVYAGQSVIRVELVPNFQRESQKQAGYIVLVVASTCPC